MDGDSEQPQTSTNGITHLNEDIESKTSQNGTKLTKNAAKKDRNKDKFRYGNYHQYYGKRLETKFQRDPRLELFRPEWFRNRAVLDVGCNAGVISILIAKDFEPRRVLGIDIDPVLVGNARKNIRHYCDPGTKLAGKLPEPSTNNGSDETRKFPDNVWFIHGNYVLESDELLEMVAAEYNVILALSITKWIHLNWGDGGLKRFFLRCYKHLMPNGRFILEAQDIRTYGKRVRQGSDEMKEHYKSIKLFPEQFNEYLLNEVGFREVIELGNAEGTSKGFSRSIVMYIK